MAESMTRQHVRESSCRARAERVSKLLSMLDRLTSGITITIEANPDLLATIVGGIRVIIDLAISFVEFLGKLADMMCP